jgi:hypothetical protein
MSVHCLAIRDKILEAWARGCRCDAVSSSRNNMHYCSTGVPIQEAGAGTLMSMDVGQNCKNIQEKIAKGILPL